MASIEFEEKLKQGALEWNEYRNKAKDQIINLCYLDLPESELININFAKCDLTGASIQGANLDGTFFRQTILHGSNLSNTSMIQCQFDDLNAENTNFRYAVIRNSVFNNVRFVGVDFSGVTIKGCQFNSCHFDNCKNSEKSEFHSNEFSRCTFTSLIFDQTLINTCVFNEVNISNTTFLESQICNCKFTQSKLNDFSQKGGVFLDNEIRASILNNFNLVAKINQIDLTDSVVVSSDVLQIKPATAILLNTAFVHCHWPNQDGEINFWGKYIPNPNLLQQPIQDIRGVDPLLRREIADAQFLVKIQEQSGSINKFLCRIWGMTTAFGQSISRLTMFSALLLISATIVLIFLDGSFNLVKTDGWGAFSLAAYNRLQILFDIFLGLGRYDTQSLPQNSTAISTLAITVKILGFVTLGLWITIASNKIANLSSN